MPRWIDQGMGRLSVTAPPRLSGHIRPVGLRQLLRSLDIFGTFVMTPSCVSPATSLCSVLPPMYALCWVSRGGTRLEVSGVRQVRMWGEGVRDSWKQGRCLGVCQPLRAARIPATLRHVMHRHAAVHVQHAKRGLRVSCAPLAPHQPVQLPALKHLHTQIHARGRTFE